MVCLRNISVDTLHKGDTDDDDDDDNNNNSVKVQNIFLRRKNITCLTNCKYRTAATLYTLETWFVSGT
jgi:hypothetical protein